MNRITFADVEHAAIGCKTRHKHFLEQMSAHLLRFILTAFCALYVTESAAKDVVEMIKGGARGAAEVMAKKYNDTLPDTSNPEIRIDSAVLTDDVVTTDGSEIGVFIIEYTFVNHSKSEMKARGSNDTLIHDAIQQLVILDRLNLYCKEVFTTFYVADYAFRSIYKGKDGEVLAIIDLIPEACTLIE